MYTAVKMRLSYNQHKNVVKLFVKRRVDMGSRCANKYAARKMCQVESIQNYDSNFHNKKWPLYQNIVEDSNADLTVEN